ncbi:MAG: helix-turn-helix transcriptional regulator [Blastocatellia bacterium]
MKKTLQTDSQRREHIRHLVRVFWIDLQIRADRYPNATTIAEHFEISAKTAQRTIEFMRSQLRMPMGYSAERRGWYYTEPHFALPAIELTEGDLVAILLAEKLARQYRGTAIGHQVEEAFAKVLAAMTNTISIDLGALSEAHSFEAAATTELDPGLFSRLGRAAIEHRRIEMTYFTATRGELTRRKADPLHLRNSLGEWYLIAWDHLRGAPRDFLVSRIREMTVMDEHFDWPQDFILEEYLNQGFGMIRGREPINVEIIFDEYQARWMRERTPFHSTEEREDLPDGGLRMRMRVTALDGVKRFVMQYGAHATVAQPEELRQSIKEEIEKMRTIYQLTEGAN